MRNLHQTKYIFLEGISKCNFLLTNFTSYGLWLKLSAFQFKTHRELIIFGNNNIMTMSFFMRKRKVMERIKLLIMTYSTYAPFVSA
jgi:hypothetical protein